VNAKRIELDQKSEYNIEGIPYPDITVQTFKS
jgi:hypothetical protein